MNSRIRDFLAVLIIQLVLTIPFYTANVYGLTISNARATKVTSNSATIESVSYTHLTLPTKRIV